MDKIKKMVKKELQEIEEQEALTADNLEVLEKLSKIYKNILDIEEKEEGEDMDYRDRGYSGYRGDNYRDGGYRKNYERDYGRQYRDDYNGPDNQYPPRMKDHLDRIREGMEMYDYGRDRYMHGGGEERIHEGLEKLMYAVCMLVESTMEFAETPQEKEIVRKHVQKLQHM